jgi:hypothetical protein
MPFSDPMTKSMFSICFLSKILATFLQQYLLCSGSGTLAFDEYARLLAELTSLTSAFRRFDPSGTGNANLNYNQFLDLVFSTRA